MLQIFILKFLQSSGIFPISWVLEISTEMLSKSNKIAEYVSTSSALLSARITNKSVNSLANTYRRIWRVLLFLCFGHFLQDLHTSDWNIASLFSNFQRPNIARQSNTVGQNILTGLESEVHRSTNGSIKNTLFCFAWHILRHQHNTAIGRGQKKLRQTPPNDRRVFFASQL